MKTYKIFYRDFDNHVEAVKQGWSWPGFFFTWIWAFVKKLWVLGGILLVAVIIMNLLFEASIGVDYYGYPMVISPALLFADFIIAIAILIFCGAKGNALREGNLLSTGHKFIKMMHAANSQMAMVTFYQEQKKEKEGNAQSERL